MKTDIVPKQRRGTKVDVKHSVQLPSRTEVKRNFKLAVSRLLNINEWNSVAGTPSLFELIDGNGKPLRRNVKEGDYLRINIPGPPPLSGHGYDWVRVERVEDRRNSHSAVESVALRVRPTFNPQHHPESVAHFFDRAATSTFVVQRDHLSISAAVYGRNEQPNTEAAPPLDKIRNLIVATGARAGLANFQWENLVRGILRFPRPLHP